jgi:putative PIG3 family NAD(P)H quinone oxidoreductase
MEKMRAVRIVGKGGSEVMQLGEAPVPTPGPEELRVRVRAAALNRADLLQAMGLYPPPPGAPQDVPGLEYAGEVAAIGDRVRRFGVGDRVMGIVGGGAFAEQLTVHEREALAIPERLDFAKAAAIPEAFLTAFDALVLQGQLAAAEQVLIHAVASGVGTAASQLASALGANVVGTSRTQDKLDRCVKELGVSFGILVAGESPLFEKQVLATTGRGADLALDLAGGTYVPETLRAMAPRGRVLLVGTLAGGEAELPLGLVLQKRLRITGTVLRSRPIEEKIAVAQAFERQVLPFFTSNRIRPVVDVAMPFDRLREGVERMRRNETLGKVVLEWS